MDFDAEYYGTHSGGEQIGAQERYVARERALDGKQQPSRSHQQKCAGGNVVGRAGAYGAHGLGQIAEHHAYRCCSAHYVAHVVGDKIYHFSLCMDKLLIMYALLCDVNVL